MPTMSQRVVVPIYDWYVVTVTGFEPVSSESKSDVLPLDDTVSWL